MALQKQPLSFLFAGGLHTKSDAKTVPTTKLLGLDNATFIKATTLAKRNGYRALGRLIDSTARQISDPVGLAHRDTGPTSLTGDELLMFDADRAYSYRSSVDAWSDTGEVASVVGHDSPIARTGTNQTMPDHATNHGVTVLAWEDNRGGVWCEAVEAVTGRVLLEAAQLDAAAISPRCVAVGDVLHIYYAVAASHRLWVAVVNPVSIVTPTPMILTEDLQAAVPTYDAVAVAEPSVLSGIRPALMAWTTADGYRVAYVSPSGVLGSPVTNLPAAATYTLAASANNESDAGIACAYDTIGNSSAAILWNDPSGTLRARFVHVSDLSSSFSTGPVSSPGTQWPRVSCEYGTPSGTGTPLLWWVGEDTDGGAYDDLHVVRSGQVDYGSNVIVADTDRNLLGHVLVSRAFYDGGSVYAAVAYPVKFFPYVAAVRISADSFGSGGTIIVASLLPGLSTGVPTRSHVASVPAVDDDEFHSSRVHAVCLGYRIQLSSEDGDQFGEQGIRLQTLDFSHSMSYGSAQLGRGLYLGGAVIQHYDGRRWAEASFLCAPDRSAGAPTIAVPANSLFGTPLMTGGATYGYRICYEEIDAQGELHQGAESVQVNVVLGGADNSVTLTIPTCRLTNKKHVRIGVYRSVANDDSQFYRVTSTNPSTTTGTNRYVDNDPTVNSVTFTDYLADTAIRKLEPLYTNGGILSNDPAPSAGQVIAGGKSRLFWSDPSDPHAVRYFQQLQDDAGVEMSASLSMRTDPYGGSVVGISVMDDGVFAFKETAIYVADGPGPDADGGLSNPNDAFTPFQLVTSDVGCKAPGSICQTPMGIAFQSEKGIKLLGRDRQVADIGADVYAYNSQTITRATLLRDRHQVVFLTDDGVTLLWDYEKGQWSRFTNHLGIDAEIIDGTYNYLRSDGRVFVETPGEYVDDRDQISMSIQTAWIKMSNYLQGWQKVLIAEFLGEWQSSHTLRVRYALDYEEGWSAPFDIDVDSVYVPSLYGSGPYGNGPYGGTVGTSDTVYQEQIHLNRRCQAIRFWIEDVQPTGSNGASFTLSELLLVGGVVRVSRPLGAARQS